jgi:DNA-binding IclR family transcriptional regulator
MGEQPSDTRSVKSALRALELLELLTREKRALSFSDFQEALAYPKASLHGLLRTMTAARWIAIEFGTKRYVLGVRVWEAGIAYTETLPIETLARPIMEKVRDATGETIQLAVLEDFEALYVAKVDGKHLLRLDSSVGMRLQPHATATGKMLLSGIADERLAEWLTSQPLKRYAPGTLTEPAAVMKEIARVRRLGYAVDREERISGVICLAVGIRNHSGAIAAAMSVSAPVFRFKKREQDSALEQLRIAATELSAALGHAAVGEPHAGRKNGKAVSGRAAAASEALPRPRPPSRRRAAAPSSV